MDPLSGRELDRLVKKVFCEVIREMKLKHRMVCFCSGGAMMKEIEELDLSFNISHPVDVDEARLLLVDLAETLLESVNQNKKIKKYLANDPFISKNVSLQITFSNRDGSEIMAPNLESIMVIKDKVYFTSKDLESSYKSFNIHVESFDDTVKLAKKSDIKKEIHQPSEGVYHTNLIRSRIAKQIAKKYDLQIKHFGANVKDKVDLIFVDFEIERILTKDEYRKIVVDSVEKFVQEVNGYEEIQPFLANKPFTHENVALLFLISINGDRAPEPPDFLYVGYNHGEVFYKSQKYPGGNVFHENIREPYEEAKRKVLEDETT